MKLSIVTINYNNAEGLERTLNSVLTQSYSEIEHIIVDGASADDSARVIKEYVQKVESGRWKVKSVMWSSEPDNGIYDAMNKGIRKATGDYVWILNSGDEAAASDVVERMMEALQNGGNGENGGVPMLLGNIVKVFSKKKKVSEKKMRDAKKPMPLDVSMLTFYQGTVPQDAAFVKRDLFKRYGLFDDKLKIVSDWKLYLNMIALGDIVPMYVDIDVVLFDMTGVSNANMERRNAEKRAYLEEVLPSSVLKDYDAHAFDAEQMNRLRKHHLYGLVYFIERVMFKLEKWGILR